jgi:uncharacterized protein (DUF362 family)
VKSFIKRTVRPNIPRKYPLLQINFTARPVFNIIFTYHIAAASRLTGRSKPRFPEGKITMTNRREFLRILAAGAAGAMLPARRLGALTQPQSAAASFGVARGSDTVAIVRKAVELVGGMASFVDEGDVVFVKPNISWDKNPEQAATTNPVVVGTVVRMAVEAGAKKIIVADNACNDARRTYKRSGIKEAAERAGASVPFMEQRRFVSTDLGGRVMSDWEVYRDAIEADKIINVPIAKQHGLSEVTLSMKNLMGLIGGRRDLLHQNLPECVVDLTAYFRPTLNILDAVRLLKANGPQGSTLKDVVELNTVAASADPVRIDAFGISLFGDALFSNDPAAFPFIQEAIERGLGRSDFAGEGYMEVNLG